MKSPSAVWGVALVLCAAALVAFRFASANHGDRKEVLVQGVEKARRAAEITAQTKRQFTFAPGVAKQSAFQSEAVAPRAHLVAALAADLKVELTAKEIELIDNHLEEAVEQREKMELAIARSEKLQDGAVFIGIPAYDGEEIYVSLVRKIAADLGPEREKEIMDELEPTIRADNAQFGLRPQSILVERQGDHYHIVTGSGQATLSGEGYILPLMAGVSDLRRENLASFSYLRPLISQ